MPEPTPGSPRAERWQRDGALIVVEVDERGIVEVSAEALELILTDAGWRRTNA